MLSRLLLLFIVVPLVELALLVQLGRWVGFWPTIGLVVLTGFVGAGLARAEGFRTFAAFQRETAAGRLPGGPILDGLAILVGGALLLTPGLLTDVVGFSLLLPPSRALVKKRVRRWLTRQIETGGIRVQMWTPFGPGGFDHPPGAGPGDAGRGGTGGGGRVETAPRGTGDERDVRDEPGLDPRHEILSDD